MIVSARLPAGKSVNVGDFADLTGTPVEAVDFGPDGRVRVHFAADVAADVQQAVEDRIESRNAAEATLRGKARAAFANNQAFLSNTLPQIQSGADAMIAATATTADDKRLAQAVKALATQVGALTQEVNTLGRLAVGVLDGTD